MTQDDLYQTLRHIILFNHAFYKCVIITHLPLKILTQILRSYYNYYLKGM